uniref:NAD(P)-dependent oxidoreductase n=1 Tax=Fulvivirga sp. TaxID=1931237 RepID=UPI00404A5516
MTTLVLGASGATGQQLVEQLLKHDQKVKVIVRSSASVPESWKANNNISITEASINTIGADEMAGYIEDCHAVASCLGHNLTFKGLYGKPKQLVTDAVKLVCNAIEKNAPEKAIKVVLMNTAGNRNNDLNEPISFGQKLIIGLIRVLVPPHSDNEKAAEYLRAKIGQNNPLIEWAVVRPDTLIDEDQVSEYDLHASPTRSAIFDPGKTSRINVGHFMTNLITENDLWNKWKGQMPVIYNSENV